MGADETGRARGSLTAWLRRITGGLDPKQGLASAPESRVPTLGLTEAPPGRFEVRGMVARGGMGRIDRVFDARMGREAAMKELVDPSESARLKMLDEAQITGQLEHPNVVPIHDIFADAEGRPAAFLMKLVEGQTLHDVIHAFPAEQGPDPRGLEALLEIFLKVCDAVAFAHSRGVVHRDIKPENVMVGSFGQVYLMDWGLAKVTAQEEQDRPSRVRTSQSRPETRGQVYGTPAYMSLEQAFGDVDSIDVRTDVYGLGGILYEILTQRPPHESAASVVRGEPPHPQETVGARALPARLCEITIKALRAAQEDRHQNVGELRQEVEAFLRSGAWFPQRRFAAGEAIVREGEQGGRTAYIIEAGRCEVWRGSDERHERVSELGPGDPFGEAALFADTPRTATVSALTDVTVTVIDRESLDRELERHAWLRSLVRAMGVRFFEVDRELKSQRRGGDA